MHVSVHVAASACSKKIQRAGRGWRADPPEPTPGPRRGAELEPDQAVTLLKLWRTVGGQPDACQTQPEGPGAARHLLPGETDS